MKKKLAALLLITMVAVQGMTAWAAPVAVPEDVRQISIELGMQYNMCPELIQALCFKESSFNPRAENGGCVGIMQVDPACHKGRMERLGVADLSDIRGNMLVAVDYLSELEAQYEDISIVLMIYNGDSSAADAAEGNADISDFACEVLMLSAELERENGK